ncbi:hypothetical protein F4561_000491 [Lipingzhangella halophila]|uniref:Uncharacterized protein n=1 Tax=Lipingzhangella halophila TaxID=1783352 RepID=A0A7W7W0I5_9ACTN|nr:hypothetical protein [Lipingzhangella halophila]MBB4929671.1 hypothetical protein [Lipingzhangella halophila]
MTDPEFTGSSDAAEWLSEGRARKTDTATARAFASYLNSLPWAGTVLDWPRIPHRELDLAEHGEDEVAAALAGTRIGAYSECLFLFAPDAPALVFAAGDVFTNFDEITGARPGHGYFCGVRGSGTGTVPAYEAFFEYDGADHVRAAV